jgi:hypothetical protein
MGCSCCCWCCTSTGEPCALAPAQLAMHAASSSTDLLPLLLLRMPAACQASLHASTLRERCFHSTHRMLCRTWLIIKVLTKVLKGSMASDVRDYDDDSDAELEEEEANAKKD